MKQFIAGGATRAAASAGIDVIACAIAYVIDR